MKYLIDTHTAIWALQGNDEKLSVKAKGLIADRTVELAVSIASAQEIAIKISKGGKIMDMSGCSEKQYNDYFSKDDPTANTRKAAEVCGVSEEEVKRWVEMNWKARMLRQFALSYYIREKSQIYS